MTGGPLRRLQELAGELRESWPCFASDEGGESGGLPVRVQSKVVMKSRARTRRFNSDIVILAWQTIGPRAVPPAPPASQLRLYDP